MKFWNFNLHFFNRIFNKHLIQKSNRKSKTLQKKRKSSLQYFPEHRVLVTINFLVFTIDFKSKQNMYADFLLLILDLKRCFGFDFGLPPFGVTICALKKAFALKNAPALPLLGQHSYIQIWYIVCLFARLFVCLFVCLCVCLFVCLLVSSKGGVQFM